ncbi:MAG: hypothetical protein IJG84_02765 [Kiritimatiellae bacterium]|nr:hypothetical protein [Kiritimatiellia bacterium]
MRIKHLRSIWRFVGIIVCGMFVGCHQYNIACTPQVPDCGAQIETRNRYKVVAWSVSYKNSGMGNVDWEGQRSAIFARCQPGVFSPSGLPIRINEDYSRGEVNTWGLWSIFVPFLVSATAIPCFGGNDAHYQVEVKFDDYSQNVSVPMSREDTFAFTLLGPIALLLPLSDEYKSEPGFRTFHEHRRGVGEDGRQKLIDEALAYGLAVRLKELEDSGKIPIGGFQKNQIEQPKATRQDRVATRAVEPISESAHQTADAKASVSEGAQLYNILSCKREAGSDFSYRFELELLEKNRSLRTFRTVQQEFRKAVKEDYVESVPGVNPNELYVEFSEYELKGGKIEGRAVVLTISVVAMKYDPASRAGTLSIRVNANQYEEARKWVRKNIETLARDKNIALTTGEIPPAAKFYLGREELKDGNILEIEFKTE